MCACLISNMLKLNAIGYKESFGSRSDILMWAGNTKMSWMLPSNHVLILLFPFFLYFHVICFCKSPYILSKTNMNNHPPHTHLTPPHSLCPLTMLIPFLMGACLCLGTRCYQRAYAWLHRLIPCSRLVNMFTCISLRSPNRSQSIFLPL